MRVPRTWEQGPLPRGLDPVLPVLLEARQNSTDSDNADDGGDTGRTIAFAVVAGIVGLAILASAIWYARKSRLNKANGKYAAASNDDNSSLQLNARRNGNAEGGSGSRTAQSGTSAVNRNTSIRSVLTLPAYSRAASNTEQVLGREGERDGVDIVVDYRGADDEEALREQEMDALYQLRSARRQQHEEREELRRQRREAQQRGDRRELADIRNRNQAATASHNSLIEDLRRDIDQAKQNRQRSASSVSYADLGIARHDGTRLRANSQESERMGLLSDAADMAAHSIRSGANSPAPPHRRHRSGSSVGSFDSDFPSPGLVRPRADSRATSALSEGRGRAGSSPEMVESDLGVESLPPPDYEDVPLDDDNEPRGRSTTPMHEPPPDYSGPQRVEPPRRDDAEPSDRDDVNEEPTAGDVSAGPESRRAIPQLPSLRISRLPAIVIEPSTAHPNNDDEDQRRF